MTMNHRWLYIMFSLILAGLLNSAFAQVPQSNTHSAMAKHHRAPAATIEMAYMHLFHLVNAKAARKDLNRETKRVRSYIHLHLGQPCVPSDPAEQVEPLSEFQLDVILNELTVIAYDVSFYTDQLNLESRKALRSELSLQILSQERALRVRDGIKSLRERLDAASMARLHAHVETFILPQIRIHAGTR